MAHLTIVLTALRSPERSITAPGVDPQPHAPAAGPALSDHRDNGTRQTSHPPYPPSCRLSSTRSPGQGVDASPLLAGSRIDWPCRLRIAARRIASASRGP